MIIIALSTFICTVVVHVYMRADTFCQVPNFLRVIFLDGLAKFYCIIPKGENKRQNEYKTGQRILKYEAIEMRFKRRRNSIILSYMNRNEAKTYSTQYESNLLSEVQNLIDLEQSVKEIRDHISDQLKKIEALEAKAKIAIEWKYVALSLDRTFFFIFLFIAIATLVAISANTFKS